MANVQSHAYHCICTELILAAFTPLQNLHKRKCDSALICKSERSEVPVPEGVVLSGSTEDVETPVVFRLEDGFEKRYFLQCKRCDLKVGYRLDKTHFGEQEAGEGPRMDVLYLLPGGLMSTEEMQRGSRVGESAGGVGG